MKKTKAAPNSIHRRGGLFSLLSRSSWPNSEVASFAVTNLMATTSFGLVMATLVLFFTAQQSFEIENVTRAASLGSLCGLVLIPLVGRLARIFSSQSVYAGALLVQGLALLSWRFDLGVGAGTAAIIAYTVSTALGSANVGGLIAELKIPSDALATTRAALRTVSNVGIGVGSLIAAVLLKSSSSGASISVLLAGVFCFLAFLSLFKKEMRIVMWRNAESSSNAKKGFWGMRGHSSGKSPYRDSRYVGLFVSNGILSTHTEVLTYLVPAVVILQFPKETSLIGIATALNAGLVILLQMRTTQRAAQMSRSRVAIVAVLSTLGMTLLLAGISELAGPVAVGALLVSIVLLTAGELWQASSEFDISYAAADQNNHQEYQAAYAFGRTLARTLAPVLLGWIVTHHPTGWVLLFSVYLLAGIIQVWLVSTLDVKPALSHV